MVQKETEIRDGWLVRQPQHPIGMPASASSNFGTMALVYYLA